MLLPSCMERGHLKAGCGMDERVQLLPKDIWLLDLDGSIARLCSHLLQHLWAAAWTFLALLLARMG